MKKLLAIACLIVSTVSMAGDSDVRSACGKVKYLDQNQVAMCSNSGANKDRVLACSNARFFYAEDFNSCLTLKGKTEKIVDCARASLNTMDELEFCIK